MTAPGPTGGAAGTAGGLRAALAERRFAVTAEIGPPRGADPAAVAEKAALLRGWVDAANVTDNQGAHVRMASLAGSLLAARAGVAPVMQLTCRDRNRIALQSDLLAAGALGIPHVLLLTGDHPCFGDHPDAAPVFDLDSVQLVWAARTLRDEGRLLSGRTVAPRPEFLIGAVENPFAPPVRFRAARLGKKIAAGAEFAQTQFVFDVPGFDRFMAAVRDRGLDGRCAVLAGVGPIRSLAALEFVRTKVPGVYVPDEVVRRLRGVPRDRVAAEGVRLCVETIEALRAIPGVAGVHVMAFGYERGVPEILERAGFRRDRAGRLPVGGGVGAG
ncbi:methylenetetrahydrofolate reductase [Pseudonocardia asaccharolytica]|uniref:Methylenetetrahydrofolate reductase n=1 Tax=Pseudonocardia asaccharolytica DSM 44247 = NBRC 16224 TaxID=1123024 RepID=A0A511DAP5_9PSEU|nr:methylenetetrahydrofolate reductase [Pseudonocardia asaccharolytica]GEL20028.1 methylenetetrahydrofolate reductase [Pseudonocardia asaccharolytica DSM 44247 = NBRC 16224]